MPDIKTAPPSPAPQNANCIRVVGARMHNLKNIDVDIPRDQLVVITGRSGSGKSSLAIDTICAEGQRQYLETLSAGSRQFVGSLPRADVDSVEGLQPTVSLDQNFRNRNRRSTVGTITEIYHYLALLMTHAGQIHCYQCEQPIAQQTCQQIRDQLLTLPERTKLMVLAPIVTAQKGKHDAALKQIRRERLVRLRVDGEIYDIDSVPELASGKPHTIEAVTDRIIVREGVESRLLEAIETAARLADGKVTICSLEPADEGTATDWHDKAYSTRYACATCDIHYTEVSPRTFSFNNPLGACENCEGIGSTFRFNPAVVLGDESLTLRTGSVAAWGSLTATAVKKQIELLTPVLIRLGFSADQPLNELTAEQRDLFLNCFERETPGLLAILERELATTRNDDRMDQLEQMIDRLSCPACDGSRVNNQARAVLLGGRSLVQIVSLSIDAAIEFFQSLKLTDDQATVAEPILAEIVPRLSFLQKVGVGYLTLGRSADTLSGGEHQRVRLATSVGSGLTNVCFVLDEPSIGLHQRDNDRLIETIRELQTAGNSVVVVEHDEAMIRAADHVIDMGPGAGLGGGQVIAAGNPEELAANPKSITGQFLRGDQQIEIPQRRDSTGLSMAVSITGATGNNLKSAAAEIPAGLFTCVTGVSGSGKSTLINETIVPAVRKHLKLLVHSAAAHETFHCNNSIERLVVIDQQPIGRSTRGCPATYVGLLPELRKLFAATKQAKQLGFAASRFSFNTKNGWCPACKGHGVVRHEMMVMPDVFAECELCRGQRFDRSILQIHFAGNSIADVLAMSVDEALEHFDGFSKIRQMLRSLSDVGLGYLKLGQSSNTLSGGELQRIKLAADLANPSSGDTLYVLDEPTTGLHFADIRALIGVMQKLVDRGNTLVVIEHNLDVIKCADWVIDLGPEGGQGGGEIVATGTPEQVATAEGSWTGRYLRDVLKHKVHS